MSENPPQQPPPPGGQQPPPGWQQAPGGQPPGPPPGPPSGPPGYGGPPPGGPPPGYGPPPPYIPPPPKRKRPRARWFVVSGVLIVLAPLVFVGALYTVLRPLTQEDGVFPADGQEHSVNSEAGEERALFSEDGAVVRCTAVDGSGTQVEFRSVLGDFNYNEWQAGARFDTGDGDLRFTCDSASGDVDVRIARLPSTGGFVAGLVIGIIGPIVLGLIGIVMLVITGILWATGAPRPKKGEPETRA